MARFAWTDEEMILAADLADDLGWQGVNSRTPGITELSDLLRGADFHPLTDRDESFRSPNSVALKINNLRASHPSHRGKGLRVSEREVPIVESFLDDRTTMKARAREIRSRLESATKR